MMGSNKNKDIRAADWEEEKTVVVMMEGVRRQGAGEMEKPGNQREEGWGGVYFVDLIAAH